MAILLVRVLLLLEVDLMVLNRAPLCVTVASVQGRSQKNLELKTERAGHDGRLHKKKQPFKNI